jgi:hypothetical protein
MIPCLSGPIINGVLTGKIVYVNHLNIAKPVGEHVRAGFRGQGKRNSHLLIFSLSFPLTDNNTGN